MAYQCVHDKIALSLSFKLVTILETPTLLRHILCDGNAGTVILLYDLLL